MPVMKKMGFILCGCKNKKKKINIQNKTLCVFVWKRSEKDFTKKFNIGVVLKFQLPLICFVIERRKLWFLQTKLQSFKYNKWICKVCHFFIKLIKKSRRKNKTKRRIWNRVWNTMNIFFKNSLCLQLREFVFVCNWYGFLKGRVVRLTFVGFSVYVTSLLKCNKKLIAF